MITGSCWDNCERCGEGYNAVTGADPHVCKPTTKQTVTVSDKPPIIGTTSPINNSVIQTVHIQSPRGGLWEWAMVALLGVVVVAVLIGGTFLIAKTTFKGYTTFVQSTIHDLESPTVVTNIQTVTNTVLVPVTTRVSEFVNTTNVTISSIKWRALGATDGDIIHIKYKINNDSLNDIVGIELVVGLSDMTKVQLAKQIISDGNVNTENPIASNSVTYGELAIPFSGALSVKDVSIGVKRVKFRQ